MTSNEPRVWDFVDLLKELNDQQTLDDLNTAFHELLTAVRERGAKGTLTYQVTVDPVWLEDGAEVQFGFDDKITLKLPDKKRSREFLFAGHGHALYTQNPFKPDLTPQETLDPDMFATTQSEEEMLS